MQAYASLWSADLLQIGQAIDLVEDKVDGFHIDVFDGHNVDELLFGPDFVAAVRGRTSRLIDIHLNVTDPDRWAQRFIGVGADMITVQSAPCADVTATLRAIRAGGAHPSLGIELGDSLEAAAALDGEVDRFLVMGTQIGIKGLDQNPATPHRVARLRESCRTDRPIFVDGGVRAETVQALADAGTDGVIPGAFVFGAPDPNAAIDRLHALNRTSTGRSA